MSKARAHAVEDNIVPIDLHKKKVSRKKGHGGGHHEEVHEGEGPWIVSYADMMTLLFCFFVIMCSFGNFDPVVVAKKSGEVADHFAPDKATDEVKAFQTLGMDIGGHPNLKGIARSQLKDGTLEYHWRKPFDMLAVNGQKQDWRSQGDSNPCILREREVS